MSYEKLLEQAYKKINVVETTSKRFEIPKVQGQVSGKNTIITNISAIASYLRRPLDHLSKYLQKELAVSGKITNDRLTLHTKLNSTRVNDKIEQYAKDFVICKECGKPDTEIIPEKAAHIKMKHCLACGAKYPIKAKL